MSDALHVLVVDDEPRIRTMVRRYLVEEGLQVSEAADGAAMRAVLEQERIDLVLLDLVMPGEDGLSLARDIRRGSDVPIIMVTGKGDLIDRVVGLEAGADDYIAKPFHLREVLARIRTVSRRSRSSPPASAPAAAATSATASDPVIFDGWRLDLGRRDLHTPDGTQVTLTSAEFELLRTFVQHPGRVLSRDQLMDLAKGRDWAAYDRTVDTQVMRLRKKIETDPANPALIKTVRGAGYLFAATVRPAAVERAHFDATEDD